MIFIFQWALIHHVRFLTFLVLSFGLFLFFYPFTLELPDLHVSGHINLIELSSWSQYCQNLPLSRSGTSQQDGRWRCQTWRCAQRWPSWATTTRWCLPGQTSSVVAPTWWSGTFWATSPSNTCVTTPLLATTTTSTIWLSPRWLYTHTTTVYFSF